MYADKVTPSMERAIRETSRRREKQVAYNTEHGVVPKTIIKSVRDTLEISKSAEPGRLKASGLSQKERKELLVKLEQDMKNAAKMLEFEYAALLRDQIIKLKQEA
jgi:excinuclease ABC subunit B